jgi:SAM-dependent methyltransferase
MSKSLDLGCSNRPKNPYKADELFGIDIFEDLSKNIKKADLVLEAIPFENDTFDYVTAYDLIEHIPRVIYVPHRRLPFIELMNEIYRVLKIGGFFFSHTPAFPQAAAFVDPTHVNFISEGTFPLYFGDGASNPPWGGLYGFKGAFAVTKQEWSGPHLLTLMQKIEVSCN